MAREIPVLIMLPPAGVSEAERFVAAGRRAAACDLIERLRRLPAFRPIEVLEAEEEDRSILAESKLRVTASPQDGFHFGRALARYVAERGWRQVAYFGGGSAPLATSERLSQALHRLAEMPQPAAVVNNLHSTDWALLSEVGGLQEIAEGLPKDNPLGWVLQERTGTSVAALSPCAATRADIDTPAEMLMMIDHPDLGPELRRTLQGAPQVALERVRALRRVMERPGGRLAVIGRSSSHVWRLLEEKTQCWVRLFVEERGMGASGRLAAGDVRSLIGRIVEEMGPRAFVAYLPELADAVLWDTRVWLAHRGSWPPACERYAADLGWGDQVSDDGLRALVEAVASAPMPILLGGHGVVSGGLLALLESLGSDHQPSRKGRQS